MSRPSLVSRFTARVRRLPFPARNVYAAMLVGALLYSLMARAIAGILPAGNWTFYDFYDFVSGVLIIVAILAFYYYLDSEIAEAVGQSRSISNLPDDEFARLKHEFVVIPLWPHLIVGAVAGAAAVQAAIDTYGFSGVQVSNVLVLLEWALTAILTFGFAFRVIRLIVLAGRFYARPIRLSIYNLPPTYEIPTVVGKAGLFLLVLWYLNLPLNLNEQITGSPATLAATIVVSLVPLAAFLIPHAILSRRLSREKTSLLVGVSQQLESAFDKLRQALEEENFEHIAPLQAAIDTLLSENRFIESIPTWPWRLGTFRIAVTAILLPVVVWLIQQLLDRFLGL